MRKPNTHYVMVGAFVSAMIVATLGAVAMLTGQVGPQISYYTILDNVADIGFGTQVRYEGYPIGQVERIEPFAEGGGMRFRVTVSVEQDWRLPADSLARIGSTSVLSAKTIDISSGTSAQALETGGRIPSAAPQDMFAVMSEVAGTFGDLSRDGLLPLIGKITDLVENEGTRIAGDAGELIATVNTLAGKMDQRLPALLAEISTVVTRLDESAQALQTVASPDNAEAVEQLVANLDQTSAIFLNTSQELQGLVGDLDTLVAANRQTVDHSLKDLRYSVGSVARNIDSMLHNLDSASRNMNEFSRLIRQNPSLLLSSPEAAPVNGTGGLF